MKNQADTLRFVFFRQWQKCSHCPLNAITALRFFSFCASAGAFCTGVVCASTPALLRSLQSLCWHLDTEPMTRLSHSGLQLGQVRTAHSWRFRLVTIGTAGAHLVTGADRDWHTGPGCLRGDVNPTCWWEIMISWELFIQKIWGRITLNLHLPSTHYDENGNQVLNNECRELFAQLKSQFFRGFKNFDLSPTLHPHFRLKMEVSSERK